MNDIAVELSRSQVELAPLHDLAAKLDLQQPTSGEETGEANFATQDGLPLVRPAESQAIALRSSVTSVRRQTSSAPRFGRSKVVPTRGSRCRSPTAGTTISMDGTGSTAVSKATCRGVRIHQPRVGSVGTQPAPGSRHSTHRWGIASRPVMRRPLTVRASNPVAMRSAAVALASPEHRPPLRFMTDAASCGL